MKSKYSIQILILAIYKKLTQLLNMSWAISTAATLIASKCQHFNARHRNLEQFPLV